MNNRDDDLPDDPPPSYQEATGNPTFTHRPDPSRPPTLPPRQPSKPNQQPPSHAQTPSSATASPSTHPPPQTFNQLLPTINRQFPPAINLYRDVPFPSSVATQRRLFLGEHQFPALYFVSLHPGGLALHNGPSEDYPPLATVAFTDPQLGRRVDVRLPPLGPPPTPNPPIALTLTRGHPPVFTFRVEVPSFAGVAGGFRQERFEWRRSNASRAVGVLGGSAVGWELVRLANELPPAGRAAGAGTGPPSGDGHEVVAACTSAVLSMTKLWKFAFLGTGLCGALGERWAVMAVVSGVVLWDRDQRWIG